MLAKAVAHHTTASFIRVVGSEFVQKYLGEGPRMVRDVFRLAKGRFSHSLSNWIKVFIVKWRFVWLGNRFAQDSCNSNRSRRSHTAIGLSLKTVLKKIPLLLFSLMKSMLLLRNDLTLRQVPIEKFNVFFSNF